MAWSEGASILAYLVAFASFLLHLLPKNFEDRIPRLTLLISIPMFAAIGSLQLMEACMLSNIFYAVIKPALPEHLGMSGTWAFRLYW